MQFPTDADLYIYCIRNNFPLLHLHVFGNHQNDYESQKGYVFMTGENGDSEEQMNTCLVKLKSEYE